MQHSSPSSLIPLATPSMVAPPLMLPQAKIPIKPAAKTRVIIPTPDDDVFAKSDVFANGRGLLRSRSITPPGRFRSNTDLAPNDLLSSPAAIAAAKSRRATVASLGIEDNPCLGDLFLNIKSKPGAFGPGFGTPVSATVPVMNFPRSSSTSSTPSSATAAAAAYSAFHHKRRNVRATEDPLMPVVKEGWLWILSKRPFIKKWKRRWFVLYDKKHMFAYESKEQAMKKDRPRKNLSLADCSLAQAAVKTGEKYSFGIYYSSRFHSNHFLKADSENEMVDWMDAMLKVLGIHKDVLSLMDFELLAMVGKGAFGRVIQVRLKQTGKVYALKVVYKKDFLDADGHPLMVETERRVLEHVNHPFIVRLHYAFQTADKLCYILDFINGGDLFSLLRRKRKLSEEWTRFYAAQVLLSLEYLHSMDIVYRDLKPENVLIDRAGFIKLTDFGLSKQSKGNRTFSIVGSPFYIAPEIVLNKGYDRSVDWWSLGILMYELMTGLPPFYSSNYKESYKNLLEKPLEFPSTMTKTAQDLLQRLITNVRCRLGNINPSLNDFVARTIRNHPFFHSTNFDAILAKEVIPPYIPDVKSDDDISAFQLYVDDLTNRNLSVVPGTPHYIPGFDYVAPHANVEQHQHQHPSRSVSFSASDAPGSIARHKSDLGITPGLEDIEEDDEAEKQVDKTPTKSSTAMTPATPDVVLNTVNINSARTFLNHCDWNYERLVHGLIAAIVNREEVHKVLSTQVGDKFKQHPDVARLLEIAEAEILRLTQDPEEEEEGEQGGRFVRDDGDEEQGKQPQPAVVVECNNDNRSSSSGVNNDSCCSDVNINNNNNNNNSNSSSSSNKVLLL